jgi:hypothetical protein
MSVAFAVLVLLLILPAFVTPVAAVSDNTNMMQQILAAVTRIETTVLGLTGIGGSLSGLQSDVTSIKAKTDSLPDDIATTLGDIRASIGSGPMNRMFMHSLTVGTGQTDSVTCTSSGPYLAYIQGRGINADFRAYKNGVPLMSGHSLPVPSSVTLGFNVGEAMKIEFVVSSETNPNSFALGIITIQTTEGAIIGCN